MNVQSRVKDLQGEESAIANEIAQHRACAREVQRMVDEEAADMQQQVGSEGGDAPGGYGAQQQQQPHQYAPPIRQHQGQMPERAAVAANDVMDICGLLVGMANRQNETGRIMGHMWQAFTCRAAAAAAHFQQQG
eukprot:3561082-Pyramimonas_sp.AAC.1